MGRHKITRPLPPGIVTFITPKLYIDFDNQVAGPLLFVSFILYFCAGPQTLSDKARNTNIPFPANNGLIVIFCFHNSVKQFFANISPVSADATNLPAGNESKPRTHPFAS